MRPVALVLAAELGVEPEPDTSALATRIRAQLSTRPPALLPHLPDTAVAFLEKLFAGRINEHQVLEKCYERTAAGQPQLVVLRGEAGIGKTRLAREFLNWASGQGAELLQASAFESGSHMPFQPLVEALRLRLERENSPKELLDDVWLAPLSQLLPELRQRFPDLQPYSKGAPSSESGSEPGAVLRTARPIDAGPGQTGAAGEVGGRSAVGG